MPQFDEFHYHEVTDRLHMINAIIDDHIVSHPVVVSDIEMSNIIDSAQNLLAEAYRIASERVMDMEETNANK